VVISGLGVFLYFVITFVEGKTVYQREIAK